MAIATVLDSFRAKERDLKMSDEQIDEPTDRSSTERAKDLLVYGPIGLALYVLESGPSLLEALAARGRADYPQLRTRLQEALDHLGSRTSAARSGATPEPEPAPESPPAAVADPDQLAREA